MTTSPPPPAPLLVNRRLRRLATVLWSGFLVAAALELVVFAFVDPQALHGLSGAALEWSPTAVYSLAFLGFWCVAAAGAALCLLLDGDEPEVSADHYGSAGHLG